MAQIDTAPSTFAPNAKRFHFDISCNEFKDETSSTKGKVIANIVNMNNDTENSQRNFSISQSYYITEGDNGIDFYKNNCKALPAANIINNFYLRGVELINDSEFIVYYNQTQYEPTTVSLYPHNITDKSILLEREKGKVVDLKGSNFIDNDENRFSVTIPRIDGLFTMVIFEGITNESEAIYILSNVKIVNNK